MPVNKVDIRGGNKKKVFVYIKECRYTEQTLFRNRTVFQKKNSKL